MLLQIVASSVHDGGPLLRTEDCDVENWPRKGASHDHYTNLACT